MLARLLLVSPLLLIAFACFALAWGPTAILTGLRDLICRKKPEDKVYY